ncbi:MAG: TlpA family protein disulfide reductase [Candidatus Omnitrophica bacterium]|nr:TlpA family protein disulfide reductase [Candidatus Omnitrophota bacterium]
MSRNKAIKSIATLVFIALFPGLFACAELPGGRKNTAFDFKLEGLNGKAYTLGSYRDKQPVALFFWTIRCDFCRDEFKILKKLYPQLVREGWALLAINILDSRPRVGRFAKAYNLPFEVLLDREGMTAYMYSVIAVPTYVIIDKKGNVVFYDNYFPADYKKFNPAR